MATQSLAFGFYHVARGQPDEHLLVLSPVDFEAEQKKMNKANVLKTGGTSTRWRLIANGIIVLLNFITDDPE